jgi:SAM-dependent methyltransferase
MEWSIVSWDPTWEAIFRSREWGRYPQEQLVRFIARNYYRVPDRSTVRILEIGCGPGSGASWLVAREGFRLSGIDGSATAIEKARARLAKEGLEGEFAHADCATLPWPGDTFDAVLDINCLACNTEAEAASIVREIYRVLKPEGLHFSFTAKIGCWGDGSGPRLDATTVAMVADGPFANCGKTRFATRESLERLYAGFRELTFEYTIDSARDGAREIAHWVFTCRK